MAYQFFRNIFLNIYNHFCPQNRLQRRIDYRTESKIMKKCYFLLCFLWIYNWLLLIFFNSSSKFSTCKLKSLFVHLVKIIIDVLCHYSKIPFKWATARLVFQFKKINDLVKTGEVIFCANDAYFIWDILISEPRILVVFDHFLLLIFYKLYSIVWNIVKKMIYSLEERTELLRL